MYDESFKHVSSVFQGNIKGISRMIEKPSERPLREIQGCLKEVQRVFQGSFKSVLKKFQGRLKNVSCALRKIFCFCQTPDLVRRTRS